VPGREIAENRPKHWKRAFLRSPCASKNPHDRGNFPRLWGEPRETRTGPQERTGFEPSRPFDSAVVDRGLNPSGNELAAL
jgi:hypothetical protein